MDAGRVQPTDFVLHGREEEVAAEVFLFRRRRNPKPHPNEFDDHQ